MLSGCSLVLGMRAVNPPCAPSMHFDWVQARNLAELMSGHRLGYDCLLLDVRDVEEFNLCHLKGGKPLCKLQLCLLCEAASALGLLLLAHLLVPFNGSAHILGAFVILLCTCTPALEYSQDGSMRVLCPSCSYVIPSEAVVAGGQPTQQQGSGACECRR